MSAEPKRLTYDEALGVVRDAHRIGVLTYHPEGSPRAEAAMWDRIAVFVALRKARDGSGILAAGPNARRFGYAVVVAHPTLKDRWLFIEGR